MSDITGISGSAISWVTDSSSSNLEHTGSVQFLYAMLQMELAQSNKDAALNKIDAIKAAQEESKLYTEQMNELRSMLSEMTALSEELESYGGENTMSSLFSKSALDTELAQAESAVSELKEKLEEAPSDNSSTVQVSSELQEYYNSFPADAMEDLQRGGKDNEQYYYELEAGLEIFEGRLDVLQQAADLYDRMAELCEKAGITVGDTITADTLNAAIDNLEATQETVSADIQQEMVYVQDYMGQYNAYTQGSSSAISEANETLKTLAKA